MNPEEKKKINFTEIGRLGAIALNSDKEKKRAAARKAAETRKAKDPDIFKKLAAMRKSNRGKFSQTEK
jgi:hypothetical protein